MKYSSKTIITAIALSAVLLSAGNASAVNFNASEKQRLAAGKVVRKPLPKSGQKGFYGGTGFVLVDAPMDVVWNAIQDWGAYHKVFPKTVSVKEVSKKNDQSLLHVKMGHKLISLEYYINIKRDPSKHIIAFDLVTSKPHDIESSRGYWRLFPQKDGRTLVAYVVSAKVPMGIINLIKPELAAKIERNLIGAPNDLKKWIQSAKGQKYFTMTAKK